MFSKLNLADKTSQQTVRPRGVDDVLAPHGIFNVEHWRDGVMLSKQEFHNGVTNIGKDTLLNIMFGATSRITEWYCGLISLASYTALAAADTMSSHAGWLEFTAYDESVRQTWGAGTASTQSITNAAVMTFNISGSGTVKGVFTTSVSTKSGTTGTLWATALFTGDTVVEDNDQIKVTYTVNAA